MTDPHDPDNLTPDADQDSYGEESMEVEPPRRAASAQFVVDSDIGSQAMLRDAMDPANQSLGEALRLSFRVLQVVIAVLVVLFVISGAKTIDPGQSGVATVWGKIVERDGNSALEPGLTFNWPYPAGEFVLFQAENRRVDVNNMFWPSIGRGRARNEALEAADIRDGLDPGRDGYVMTAGDEIAHIQLNSSYVIENVRDFVTSVRADEQTRPTETTARGRSDDDFVTGDKLMQLALQRAAIHAAAQVTLDELILEKESQALGVRIQTIAQAMLDDLDGGMRIMQVNTPDVSPPLSIEKLASAFDQASENAKARMERARKRAEDRRIDAAGDAWGDAIRLINEYENLIDGNGGATDQQAALHAVYAHLESDAVGGEVASIISTALSFQALVDSSLGADAQRFASLLPIYRRHPNLVVRQRWLETITSIMLSSDLESIGLPPNTGTLGVAVSGSQEIAEQRRQNRLNDREREAQLRAMSGMRQVDRVPWGFQRGRDFTRRRLSREVESHSNTDN
jgi:regulator of protease activity HflC (stomatin/prohibitin superfamily)